MEKNQESYGSTQSTVLSAAEKSKPGKQQQQQQHIVLSDLVVIAAGFNMMTRGNSQMGWVETWAGGEQMKTVSEDSS